MNASDFLKQLDEDSEYQKIKKKNEENLQKTEEEIVIIEKPFIEYLHKNGYRAIKRTSDLLVLKNINGELTAIIQEWLPKMDNRHGSQEMLVRALVLAEIPFDGTSLTELFDNDKSALNLKWVIGNTFANARVKHIAEWLEKKLSADQPGKECEMLVYAAIKYLNYEKANNLLRRLFPIFPLQVSDAFTYIGKIQDLPFLQEKSKSYKGEQLTQINKAIKKLSSKV
jgi:hypothetical protein